MTNITGVPANHSSLAKSAKGEGVQYNDADDDNGSAGHLDPSGSDPNISGTAETAEPLDWMAGPMSGWCENDDYLQFTFNTDHVAGSRLDPFYPIHDGDYDDNGGYPSPIAGAEPHGMHNHSEFGSDESAHQGSNDGWTRR